jgi:hypothetical protein
MKLSEVISALQALLSKYGDLTVYSAEIEGGSVGEIEPEGIRFDRECAPFYMNQTENIPDRIMIALN